MTARFVTACIFLRLFSSECGNVHAQVSDEAHTSECLVCTESLHIGFLDVCMPLDCDSACPGDGLSLQIFRARPGVLTHLALPGKRLGDEGAIALASTLMTIRSVDLRQNNIGDSGGRAIASALMPHDVTTEVSLMSCPQPQRLERHQPEHQRQQHERASPDADRIGGDRNTALRQCPKNRLHALQTLSLAGNRIGDAGANALSEMLEFRKRRSNVDHEALLGHVKPNTRESCEFRWLSVAENPRISECGQKRLIGAATRCFLPHGSDKNRGVDRLDCNFVVIV